MSLDALIADIRAKSAITILGTLTDHHTPPDPDTWERLHVVASVMLRCSTWDQMAADGNDDQVLSEIEGWTEALEQLAPREEA